MYQRAETGALRPRSIARDSFDLNAIGVTRRRLHGLGGEKHIQARCSASIHGLPARSFPVVVRLQALCGLAILIFCEDSFLAQPETDIHLKAQQRRVPPYYGM